MQNVLDKARHCPGQKRRGSGDFLPLSLLCSMILSHALFMEVMLLLVHQFPTTILTR